MPTYVAGRIADALNNEGKAVKGARLFILGVSYKPDVGDVRESPAIKVAQMLSKRGAKIKFHDPYIDAVTLNGSVLGRSEVAQRAIGAADCVAVLTPTVPMTSDGWQIRRNWCSTHAMPTAATDDPT